MTPRSTGNSLFESNRTGVAPRTHRRDHDGGRRDDGQEHPPTRPADTSIEHDDSLKSARPCLPSVADVHGVIGAGKPRSGRKSGLLGVDTRTTATEFPQTIVCPNGLIHKMTPGGAEDLRLRSARPPTPSGRRLTTPPTPSTPPPRTRDNSATTPTPRTSRPAHTGRVPRTPETRFRPIEPLTRMVQCIDGVGLLGVGGLGDEGAGKLGS